MNVQSTSAYWQTSTQYTAASTYGRSSSRSSTSTTQTSGSGKDSISISEQARAMSSSAQTVASGSDESGIKGASSGSLRNYINVGSGYGNSSIDALNNSRNTLSSRINSLISGTGVKLGKNDKLTISIDKDNNIVVGGIKDKKKAEQIQEALNQDLKLGRDLRRHAALGIVNANEKRQQAAEQNGMQADTDDLYTNRAVRAFVIDDYLESNANVGLNGLSIEKLDDGTEVISGMTEELGSLIGQDPTLGDTIKDILKNGETSLAFETSFEFANGMLSDSASQEKAKDKIKSIAEMINGNLSGYLKDLEEAGVEVDPEMRKALGQGFKIRVSSAGDFDIVGAEDMDAKIVSMLRRSVEKALEEWGGKGTTFADVAKVMVDQHQFEHGDNEYAHMLEINFRENGEFKVVSPDADRAQDEKNQKVAGELGEALREMLNDEGISADNLEMVIDQDGKITVVGDPMDPTVKQAQSFIDKFMDEGDQAAKVKKEEKDHSEKESEEDDSDMQGDSDAKMEALRIRTGQEKDVSKFLGTNRGRVEATAEYDPLDNKIAAGTDYRLADFPKYDQSMQYASGVDSVSTVTATWNQPESDEVQETGTAEKSGSARERALALYAELKGGMKNFHDERRNLTYRLAA